MHLASLTLAWCSLWQLIAVTLENFRGKMVNFLRVFRSISGGSLILVKPWFNVISIKGLDYSRMTWKYCGLTTA